MLIKTVYTKNNNEVVEENVYECSRYVLKRGREGNSLRIEMDNKEWGEVPIPTINAYEETFAIYIMNSNGKTTDSYFFGEFKKDKKVRVRER